MNYLPMMTVEEIKYVCSVIPLQDTVKYFKRNPKEFAKVLPGFRPVGLKSQTQANAILFRSRNQHFISSFIEKHIGRWLDEIAEAIQEKIDKGADKEIALLQTLPHCFFLENIGLYFKLTGVTYTDETVSILGNGIKVIKDLDIECERLQSALADKTSELELVEVELGRIRGELNKANKTLSERLEEVNALKHANASLEKNKTAISSLAQTITDLEKKAKEREDYIRQLSSELSVAKNEQSKLEQKSKEEFAKQQEADKRREESARKPQCPSDLDEFKDYLGFNFESLGMPAGAEYFVLIKDYLSEILFQGKPLVISKSTSESLMKCVSNTLVGMSAVSTLAFSNEITEKVIIDFLSQDRRIFCLDNFIGNYNETLLITLCNGHKDKIIFLTVAYDHTLSYVPDESMRYCNYLNFNRIAALVGDKELTEDPSYILESEATVHPVAADARWSAVLTEILDDIGFRGALPAYKASLVVDELALCRMLAFDILPYCIDVLKIAPFSISERLVKYAGDSGRCLYKDLFRRWFA